jgi:hypothetical protein
MQQQHIPWNFSSKECIPTHLINQYDAKDDVRQQTSIRERMAKAIERQSGITAASQGATQDLRTALDACGVYTEYVSEPVTRNARVK